MFRFLIMQMAAQTSARQKRPLRHAIGACAVLVSVVFAGAAHAKDPQAGVTRFTGAAVEATTQSVAIAYAQSDDHAGIQLRPLERFEPQRVYPVPDGLVPFDPSFSHDGETIVYAALCPAMRSDCSDTSAGWNIYELTLATGLSRQMTTADPHLIRVTPRYDSVTGAIHFVGIASTTDQPGFERVASPSAIFQITQDGDSVPVFPKDSYSPASGALHHPIGTLTAVDLLGVADGRLSIKARFQVPTTRPALIDDTDDHRLTDAADRLFYGKPRRDFRDRETANTLFFIDKDTVRIAEEFSAVATALAPRLNLHIAATDPQTGQAFGIVQSLDQRVRNTIASVSESDARIVQNLSDLKAVPVDFEVAGDHAVLFVQEADASTKALVFTDWGAPRHHFVFTPGEN